MSYDFDAWLDVDRDAISSPLEISGLETFEKVPMKFGPSSPYSEVHVTTMRNDFHRRTISVMKSMDGNWYYVVNGPRNQTLEIYWIMVVGDRT